MPEIRNKSLQNRRMAATLSGLGQFEEDLAAYDFADAPTSQQSDLQTFLSFGRELLQPPQSGGQVIYAQPQASQSPFAGMTPVLMLAAGLAAIFILTMPKGK